MSTLPFINPATGEAFGEVQSATTEDVTRAIKDMRQAFQVWRKRPLKDRITVLRQLQEVIIDSLDEITAVLNQDTGKSRQDGLIEVMMTVDRLHQYYRNAPVWLKRRRVPPGLYVFKSYYKEPHPYGVVAVIGPWNYPFDLTMPVVCSALLAGNTVVLKPSEVTAATGVLVESLIKRVPELSPFVRVLHGGPDIGAAVVQSSPDLVFLTGSTGTGRKIAKATAETMTPFIAELGGKDPMIVLESADIAAAAKWGTWGAFYNTGQTCMGIERVYVVESIYDEFLRQAVSEAKQIKQGYVADIRNENNMGPLTFERQLQIVQDQLDDALAKGARIIYGGKIEGLFVEPTIIVDVTHDMKLMQEETFGPIMPVMKVKDETEALWLANDSVYGLSASVWSNNMRQAKRVAHRLDVGSVNVNDAISHYPVSLLPFGGVKQSGNARTHGKEEVLQFTQMRSYAIGRPPLPIDLATRMREPNHYKLGAAIMRMSFGVTPRQRLQPLTDALTDEELQPDMGKIARLAGAATDVAALALTLFRAKK
ncbi:MAG: aldehyde dehydrogenase family protein [Anaerolineales bacterium]|nr:aldehyde dehydrogenase family protein [Anaerolineales bacterium]